MKRKPPVQNVRRVRAINGNSRYTIVNKCQRSIQCESFQEYKLVLLLERNPLVRDYLSQPETLLFYTDEGREMTYTPDFKVWMSEGEIILHEVTLTKRRSRKTQQQREAAAERICTNRSWQYVVHTENTLPTGAELANLQLLFRFRASGFADPDIIQLLSCLLPAGEHVTLCDLITRVSEITRLDRNQFLPVILHQIWHGKLQINWQKMLFHEVDPNPTTYIWQEISS